MFKRFRHWVKLDVFKRIFEAVSEDPDMAIRACKTDASHAAMIHLAATVVNAR